MTSLLAKFLVPHRGNNHHPHSIRAHLLLFYLVSILGVQLGYNYFTTGEVRVLSFATNISQQEIINYTNQQRQQVGAGTLKESQTLDQVAAKKAADMFANNYWAHTSPSGVTPWYWYDQTGYKYLYAGENLARDFDTSAGVIQGWMNSPSHKENLLFSNYTEIGVAVVNGQLLGHDTTLVVQEFGKPQFAAVAASEAPSAQGTPVSAETQPQTQPSTPVISNPYVASPPTESDFAVQPSVLSIAKLNQWQVLMLMILVPILAFFIFDTVLMWRRKLGAVRGHSFMHAGIIAMLIAILITASYGVLR